MPAALPSSLPAGTPALPSPLQHGQRQWHQTPSTQAQGALSHLTPPPQFDAAQLADEVDALGAKYEDAANSVLPGFARAGLAMLTAPMLLLLGLGQSGVELLLKQELPGLVAKLLDLVAGAVFAQAYVSWGSMRDKLHAYAVATTFQQQQQQKALGSTAAPLVSDIINAGVGVVAVADYDAHFCSRMQALCTRSPGKYSPASPARHCHCCLSLAPQTQDWRLDLLSPYRLDQNSDWGE